MSTGAQQWARQHDIHTCDPDELITGKLDYLLAFFVLIIWILDPIVE